MDITPQLLKEVKFSESWRGYDREEVDEFLERVGAGVAAVQGRLREAIDRAEAAEARAIALGNRSEAEETLRRTLVLAQRTADAAVAEANETAARAVAEAEARAARIIGDADAHAATLRAEADAEVRRVVESTRAPLVEEIKELERTRGFLRDDIGLLERHVSDQRLRLHAEIADLQRLLDEPSRLRMEPMPETSGVDPSAALSQSESPLPPPAPPAPTGPTGPAAPTPTAPPIAEAERHEVAPDPEPSWAESSSFDLPPFDPPFSGDPGPPTRPIASIDTDSGPSGDAFLEQLRRAVDDDSDADHAMTAFFDQDDDDRPRSRFGRRR